MPTPKPSDVRQWARASGLETADRGRLPRSVLEAYADAHAGPSGTAARRRGTRSRSTGRRGDARSPAQEDAARRTDSTPAAPSDAATAGTTPDQRLQAVEAQLADALARIAALETRSVRSLLGLRITL